MIAELVREQLLGVDLLVAVVPVNVEHDAVFHWIFDPDPSVFVTLPLCCSLEVGVAADAREDDLVEGALDLLLPARPVFVGLLLRKDAEILMRLLLLVLISLNILFQMALLLKSRRLPLLRSALFLQFDKIHFILYFKNGIK